MKKKKSVLFKVMNYLVHFAFVERHKLFLSFLLRCRRSTNGVER